MHILNLHEIREEVLVDYTGDFEMTGELSVGEKNGKTHIRLINIDDYVAYINAIDLENDGEGANFNGYINELETPQLNLFTRSQYRNGTDFKQDIVEYTCNICYIPTGDYCFIKCIKVLTRKDYKQQVSDFIREKKTKQFDDCC